MALAPHKIQQQGSFFEKQFNHFFEFDGGSDRADYPQRVWVTTPREGIDSGWRYAVVKKTVAYVVVDEADDGGDVVEKWEIKSQRQYAA
jgi:hypothetical protein